MDYVKPNSDVRCISHIHKYESYIPKGVDIY